jgi:hypothetical protein
MGKYIAADKLAELISQAEKEFTEKSETKGYTTLEYRHKAEGLHLALQFVYSLQQDKDVLDLCSQVWWEDRGWIMIPPNVTLEGIDSLLKQVRKKLPQYYKLRDIETGRTFMAEFSEIAGEWYEKGTGEAHSIASVEMVKEQPEPVKGKFVFPKFLYARTLDNKTIDVSYGPQDMTAIEYVRNDFVEQQEVNLDAEIDKEWRKNNPIDEGMGVESVYIHIEAFDMIVRHFYELGLNVRKED